MIDSSRQRVAEVRAFNRFYTALLGLLENDHLHLPYTLTEARVLFELGQADQVDLLEVRQRLGLDAGYLTRLVTKLAQAGLVTRERSATDARRQVVRLTEDGRDTYRELSRRSSDQIGELLGRLPEPAQQRLLAAMGTVRDVLGEPRAGDGGAGAEAAVRLRAPEPGDLGWVVSRNGAIYAAEYGWDADYEALVARIVADYVEHRDPARETAWIAERDGVPVGCVFCVRADEPDTAKLRLLLVEPAARGLGVGGRLVDECLRYATEVGYRRMVLWTNDVLTSARRIYARAGFELVDSAKHRSFGHELVGETWARPLGGAR
ncbi:MarR family transcriptional regulator [Actinocatenispora thailandica]|uniref:MarR family transcriptional regulator n=1 Tax=Actinocatenispora thailandica TaxID=227318 RepID=A0A7R7DJ79_9ACTN|nr:helix-turn-helix domain-containing GNAT family N-acetyltransferase [Actinocatenispora thailandica]BCJ32625.1 MarR family transcriptional regulator [Actinocatenispora thailandica]